jgi:probable phosphoglycerate mutase
MKTMTAADEASRARRAAQEEIEQLFRLDDEEAAELLLVRHAEPADGAEASGDPLLSCAGLEQAERLAHRLSDSWVECVVSAPERRAVQTARLVAEAAGRPLIIDERLREIDFVPPSKGRGCAGERGYARRFVEDPRWEAQPGFSSSHAFRRRVLVGMEEALAAHPGRRVVVVTHGSVINAYASMLLGIKRDMFFAPDHASITVVRQWRDLYAVRCLNDTAHLGGARSPTATFNGAFTVLNQTLNLAG